MKTILVIREYDDFSRILAADDYKIINLPLIETKAFDDLSDFDAKLAAIEEYDGIFTTSQNAARILAEKLREKNINFGGRVYVLGKRSYELLKTETLNLVYDETANTAREMLEKIAPEELKDKRFLFARGEKSLRVVPDFLSKIASVDEAIIYETRKIRIGIDQLKAIGEKIEAGEIFAACFFSLSAAESFIEQFAAKILHQTEIATIGTTTAEFFEKRNLRVGFISMKATAEDFAAELVEYLGRNIADETHERHAKRKNN